MLNMLKLNISLINPCCWIIRGRIVNQRYIVRKWIFVPTIGTNKRNLSLEHIRTCTASQGTIVVRAPDREASGMYLLSSSERKFESRLGTLLIRTYFGITASIL